MKLEHDLNILFNTPGLNYVVFYPPANTLNLVEMSNFGSESRSRS